MRMHWIAARPRGTLRRMRRAAVALALVLSASIWLIAAAPAPAKVRRCTKGTVQVKVRSRATCIAKRLAVPAPVSTAPALAQLRGALTLTQVGFTARGGRRAAPLSRRVGRSWATARARLLRAMSATISRFAGAPRQHPAERTARAAASDACQVIDVLSQGGPGVDSGPGGTFGGSFTSGGVGVSLGVTSSGGMQLGMQTTTGGDTYTMTYESGESECTKHALPACPEADGSLNAYGTKGKVGFSLTVTRGGKVLSKRSYAKTITVETKGQVADDAKLDFVDVRYSETTVLVADGLRYTSYGTRLTRIDMRSGTYAPGESVSIGSAAQAGELVNTAGLEADAGDFAAFVGKTIGDYRSRESAWQSPGACAKLAFDPARDTVDVVQGATGTLHGQVQAVRGGTAAKARWTLSGQQNGTFTPESSNDGAPTFSYTVASDPDGETLSVTAHATSTAGVAEDTWSQKIKKLTTISGTFTGHATDVGLSYDWTGTATFTRTPLGAGVTGATWVFQLASGQATVTVSGSQIGSSCQQTGTSTIGLFPKSPWTVAGTAAPFSYQVNAAFLPDPPQATNTSCADPKQNGTPAGLGSMSPAALQSGDNGTLGKTTDDFYTYSGSADATGPADGQTVHWTWSFTGSP